MIHLIQESAADQQIREMLDVHESFIKLAVDITRGILAGGGEFHADCESMLIEAGSQRADVWGADWVPDERAVRFTALINIRPRLNESMEIQDVSVRQYVERIARRLLQRP